MKSPEYFRTSPEIDLAVTASKDAEARLVFGAIQHLADPSIPVLILGEPGTGRGAIARALHRLDSGSDTAGSDSPMLEVDCGDLEDLSCLRVAGRGTVYLREVEELRSDLQATLAELAGDSVATRLVVSGSPRLAAMTADGCFSGALLASLGRASLHLPPLRDRPLDVPDLVGFTLDRYCLERGAPVRLAEAAMGYLIDYDWPGNVAELEQVVERLCESADGEFVSADQLPPQIRWFPGSPGRRARSKGEVGFNPLSEEFQFRLIADALRRTQGR